MNRRRMLSACGGVTLVVMAYFNVCTDVTEAGGKVYLRNDVNTPADLAICDDAQCGNMAPTQWRSRLSFGTEVGVNVSTEHVPTTYRVNFQGSGITRCLTLILDQTPQDHLVVPLSSAKPCSEVR
jgi:hypothetical protein